MATRSTIAIENADGTVHQVYCHFDGYLSGVGQMLIENYQDRDKVAELVSLGDISVLGPTVGVKHPFDNTQQYGTREWQLEEQERRQMTLYYGRDRGETETDPKVFKDFADYEQNHQYEEYEYIFSKDNVWSFSEGDDWCDLEEELQQLESSAVSL